MSLEINKYVLDLLKSYVQWQIQNQFPPRNTIEIQDNTKYDQSVSINGTTPTITEGASTGLLPLSSMIRLINKQREQIETPTFSSNVFKEILKDSDYRKPIKRHRSFGVFPSNDERAYKFYTQSLTSNIKQYYMSVYNNIIFSNDSKVLDIAYCHISGSGSFLQENGGNLYPSKIMYKKYNVMCNDDQKPFFTFKNDKKIDHLYVMEFNRNHFKDLIDPGNLQLSLCHFVSESIGGSPYNPTGSARASASRIYTLIDDSYDDKEKLKYTEGVRDFYYLASGSLKDGIYDEPTSDAWGLLFPKMGIVMLDADVLDMSCSFNTGTGSLFQNNMHRLFFSISGASTPRYDRGNTEALFCRSSEEYLTETYFCRLGKDEFNYSNNPTYLSGSDGQLQFFSFIDKPKTYLTTIGLYDRQGELIAVGKTRNPMLKDSNTEYIIQVRVRVN